jgi:Calcineurin-like phosphoesterase
MRIGCISDVHVWNHRRFGGPFTAGLNRRCRQVVDSLALACKTAGDEGCSALVIAGDLFDGVRPEPQVISAVQEALDEGPSKYIVKGNHDSVSDIPGDHALGPLLTPPDTSTSVGVYDEPEWEPLHRGDDATLLLVPFCTGKAEEWLPRVLDSDRFAAQRSERALAQTILVVHLGIADEKTAPYLLGSPDSISAGALSDVMRARGIRAAFCGNWHEPRHWGFWSEQLVNGAHPVEDIFQVGALCPTGFDNPGPDYGRLVIWDTAAQKSEQLIIPGPRFLKLDARSDDEQAVKALVEDGCQVYVSVTTDREGAVRARSYLERLVALGVIDGEVALDAAEAEVAARGAAQAARGAGSLTEAVAAFVEQMSLEAGVDRAEVIARALEYMKTARGA